MGSNHSQPSHHHNHCSSPCQPNPWTTTTVPEETEKSQAQPLGAPPPYSQHAPAEQTQPASGAGDSPYAFLRDFDTVFLVDDSSSMAGSRWREAGSAIASIAPICTQYDGDGIDIYFLNHRRQCTSSCCSSSFSSSATGAYENVTTAAEVQAIFDSVSPCGATPVGKRLHQILKPYLRSVERMAAATDGEGNLANPTLFVKPLNIIVITDGVFTDDAESVIVDAAKRLDGPRCNAVPWQVGIQFFQIGQDEAARQHLQELDDELGKINRDQKLRDMVDTVPWRGRRGESLTADGIIKVVLGAIHKKYDKRDAFH